MMRALLLLQTEAERGLEADSFRAVVTRKLLIVSSAADPEQSTVREEDAGP